MSRSISFLLSLLLIVPGLFAQEPHPNAVNVPQGIVAAVKADPKTNITPLVDALLTGITTPEEKVRVLHDWVALNIQYDVNGFLGNSPIVYDTYDVIKTGRSVCEGYCNVFEVLLTTAGIENKKISGYARGYGFNLFKGDEKFEANHAWTAVKLAGKWSLIDVTWNSGYIDGMYFTPNYSLGYFMMPPEKFLYTHFPEDPQWQLVTDPKEFWEFAEMPYLTDRFFALDLDLVTPPARVYNTTEEFKLQFKIPDDVIVTANLYDMEENRIENRALTQRSGPDGTIDILFPSAGKFHLTMFAKFKDAKGPFIGVAEFGFIASAGRDGKFPVLFKKFIENGCKLIKPGAWPFKLAADSTVEFEFYAPGDEAGVETPTTMVMFQKNAAGNFAGKVKITGLPVRPFMKNGYTLNYICSWE